MRSMVPLGRIGQPDEIGKVAVFLASQDASFVTGVELFVDEVGLLRCSAVAPALAGAAARGQLRKHLESAGNVSALSLR